MFPWLGRIHRGSKAVWSRHWLFRWRPGRDRSKRSSIHHPIGLLARYSLFGGFLSLVSSVSVAQDPATVGQWSSVMSWPYKAVHAHVLPTGKVIWWPPFDQGDNPTLWDPADKFKYGSSKSWRKHLLFRPCLPSRWPSTGGRWAHK